MKTYLVGDILTKVDRASMAHALEVREPLLDHELMGWVSGLPVDLKLRGTEGKYLLKKSMEPYLPHDVLYRKKMGFSVPLAAWFRGPLAITIRSVVLGERLASTGLFNQDYLREVVEAHQSGRRDYSVILWTVLMFDAFLGQVLGMDGQSVFESERQAARKSSMCSTIPCRCIPAIPSAARQFCATSEKCAGRPITCPAPSRSIAR